MKSSVVVALVAAGAIAGGGFTAYELAQPSDSVGVQFVTPASQVQTTTPTVSVTTSATSVPVASKSTTSTTTKATRTKEGTVTTKAEQPAAETTTSAPQASVAWPPPVDYGTNDQSLRPSATK